MLKYGMKERVKYISLACGIPQNKVKKMLKADADCIIAFLKEGQAMSIANIGVIKPRTIGANEAIVIEHPTYGTINIPAHEAFSSVRLKPYRSLKKAMKELTYGDPFDTKYDYPNNCFTSLIDDETLDNEEIELEEQEEEV